MIKIHSPTIKNQPGWVIKAQIWIESKNKLIICLLCCVIYLENDAGMNEHHAFINFQKSAETGEPSRIGVKMNEHNAFIHHQKSAEMGNGIGVEMNEPNAFIYYQKSVGTDDTSERSVKSL